MKKVLLHRALLALALITGAGLVHSQPSGQSGPQDEAQQEKNLLLALSQVAGMRVCDGMRNRFRTLSSEGQDGKMAANGTLWLENCTASTDGTHLSMSLGGQGWRWVYRVKDKVGAEFQVSQYVTFAVNVKVEGEIDAAYQPDKLVFNFWFKPSGAPSVTFRPLGNVKVDEEGLWSSVVGSAASIFMKSPSEQAEQQLRQTGRENLKAKFSQGYSARLDFCTGELHAGFGMARSPVGQKKGADEASEEQTVPTDNKKKPKGTSAYMHAEGLILDGPYPATPEFSVDIESDALLQAELVCESEAIDLARSFIEKQKLPEVRVLNEVKIDGAATLKVEQSSVNCPVVLILRGAKNSPKEAFGFHYKVNTAPLMKPAEGCEPPQ